MFTAQLRCEVGWVIFSTYTFVVVIRLVKKKYVD